MRSPHGFQSLGEASALAHGMLLAISPMTDREAKSRAVKILAKSIYRDLEAQGFDEKQIVALATELISEVTNKMSRGSSPSIPPRATIGDKQQVA